jgi:hypothetical protein
MTVHALRPGPLGEPLFARACTPLARALLAAGLAAGFLAPERAQAQGGTALPAPALRGEVEKAMQARPDVKCERCGTVVSVRQQAAKAAPPGALPPPMPDPGASPGGPGGQVQPLPLVGQPARDYREALRQPPATLHVVTIRYDNGSYGVVELVDEPPVQKGDRVRVEKGVLERLR